MTENFKEKVKIFSQLSIVLAFLVALLIVAKVVIVPLAISFLFVMILNPLVKRMEKVKIPRIPAILLAMLSFVLILGGILTYSGFQLAQLIEDLPSIERKVIALVQDIGDTLESRMGISAPQQDQWINNLGNNAGSLFTGLLQTTSSVLTVVAQIPIYIFLLLLYKDKFRAFVIQLFDGAKGMARERIDEIKGVIQGYVLGLFIVIGILAVLNSVGLLLLGIKYALFFGIFSAILTIIPYIGNFVGGLFPFLVALVTKDSAWYAVGVVALYAVIQFIEGNFITPNIMGSRVNINPLIALIAMILGGQILGVAGLILAIPFIGILRIAFSHSQTLSPFVILMEEHK
ncbi:MAG TPA: AI-2E family transporter [Cryomorphaceae bacterium]|nr:AI-2E family transporter [Owenweeksia sp.]MBF99279.1 AI-2E family transporter [Owenweeksia sp.]HAD96710.1 AI-2E family transporter [Cryomorphaceae bacterium]HBF21435.1 AI-2E family transporter [Cryomorphaceae bacterium]HCQ15153.1 AI-2E family transporter [Cryomorphaceae bacterium]|tara:strand:- start:1521 stop:2555 length:1035 start_codon:yes stop_codon:yes gene_type:complete